MIAALFKIFIAKKQAVVSYKRRNNCSEVVRVCENVLPSNLKRPMQSPVIKIPSSSLQSSQQYFGISSTYNVIKARCAGVTIQQLLKIAPATYLHSQWLVQLNYCVGNTM